MLRSPTTVKLRARTKETVTRLGSQNVHKLRRRTSRVHGSVHARSATSGDQRSMGGGYVQNQPAKEHSICDTTVRGCPQTWRSRRGNARDRHKEHGKKTAGHWTSTVPRGTTARNRVMAPPRKAPEACMRRTTAATVNGRIWPIVVSRLEKTRIQTFLLHDLGRKMWGTASKCGVLKLDEKCLACFFDVPPGTGHNTQGMWRGKPWRRTITEDKERVTASRPNRQWRLTGKSGVKKNKVFPKVPAIIWYRRRPDGRRCHTMQLIQHALVVWRVRHNATWGGDAHSGLAFVEQFG